MLISLLVSKRVARQIFEKDPQQPNGSQNTSLVEIGPRFVLTPIRIFEGAFGGATVYSNPGSTLYYPGFNMPILTRVSTLQNLSHRRRQGGWLSKARGTDTASGRMLNKIMHRERRFAEKKRMCWQCPKYLDSRATLCLLPCECQSTVETLTHKEGTMGHPRSRAVKRVLHCPPTTTMLPVPLCSHKGSSPCL